MGANFKEINYIYFLPLFSALFYALSMVITKITSIKEEILQQLMHFQIGGFFFGGIASLILYFVNFNYFTNKGLIFFWDLG